MATTARSVPRKIKAFQRAVLRFYRTQKRNLPWRRTRDPYPILVSEIMLQQTQVERVIPKYLRFLSRFPTLRSLARARLGDVIREWLGLGYNARAVRLWRSAQAVVREHGGKLPADTAALQRLPGIGPYTAAAVAAIAFDARVAAIDVNVRRVLTRALAGSDRAAAPRVSLLAQHALPDSSAGEWLQALMDIGAAYCKATPRCEACPLRLSCAYLAARQTTSSRAHKGSSAARRLMRRSHVFVGSTRFYRGRALRALSVRGSVGITALGRQVKAGFDLSDAAWLRQLLEGLARDGLIRIDRSRRRVCLP